MHHRPLGLPMLIVLALIVLLVISLTIGAFGVALFIAGYGLGWLTGP